MDNVAYGYSLEAVTVLNKVAGHETFQLKLVYDSVIKALAWSIKM